MKVKLLRSFTYLSRLCDGLTVNRSYVSMGLPINVTLKQNWTSFPHFFKETILHLLPTFSSYLVRPKILEQFPKYFFFLPSIQRQITLVNHANCKSIWHPWMKYLRNVRRSNQFVKSFTRTACMTDRIRSQTRCESL